jgi:hypothetical protein
MKKLNKFLILLLSAWAFGCYPGGVEFVEDLDTTFTTYDKNYSFQTKDTYSLPDEIVVDVEIDRNGDTTYVYMKPAYAQPILAQIESNMSKLGWTKVELSSNPDVILTPAAIATTTVFYSYWYDWWYGGYYPGWGWYYPPYYQVSSYTTGTVLITMADPNVNNPIERSKAVWIARMNGLLTGTYDLDRAIKGIDQAFAQSPYLKTN